MSSTKHPLEQAGTALIILTLSAAYIVGGLWGVKALMDAGIVWLAFLLMVLLLVIAGALLAGAGTSIRESQLVRKDYQ